jgi:hypothetical protein
MSETDDGRDTSGTPFASSSSSSTQSDIDPGRAALLEEARTTASDQLSQINKIDDAAVRTVRITLLILGILAGGPSIGRFPNLGFAGVVGTVSLILTLIGAITVYGTSRVFIGSAPGELAIDYKQRPIVENTFVEMLNEYDDGITDNRRTLRANGFILGISRTLLVIAIIAVIWGFTSPLSGTDPGQATNATAGVLTLITIHLEGRNEMSDTGKRPDVNEGSEGVSQPVSIYTGPKTIADAKIALGKWLESHDQ